MGDEVEQFKSLTDLREEITKLEGYFARPTIRDEHPTLYPDEEGKTVMGIRVCDYKLSADGQWALKDEQMGLSFSASWQHLKGTLKMLSRGGEDVDVYWMLSSRDLPEDMKFEADRRPSKSAKGHYLLTVTKDMKISTLVQNLKMIADGFSVMKNAGGVR